MNPSRRRRRAQGITEYVLLVGVVAVGLLLAVSLLGGSVEEAYDKGALLLARSAGEDVGAWAPRESPGNPYRWNHKATRWYDPADGNRFVGKEVVAPYEPNIDRFKTE